MSTHAVIAALGEQETDPIRSIYLHHAGEPEAAGRTLVRCYASTAKVQELLGLGNLAVLGAEVGEKHDFSDSTHPNWCCSYRRDNGETSVAAREWRDWDSADGLRQLWNAAYAVEYAYIMLGGQWYVASRYNPRAFVPLTAYLWEADGHDQLAALAAKGRIIMQTQANISQCCPLHRYTTHAHSDRELLLIARAVVTHAIRRPHSELACEYCYTASKVGACGMCVHRYALVPPSAKLANVAGNKWEVTIEVDAEFMYNLEQAIAAIPAPHSLDLLGSWLGIEPATPSNHFAA